MGLLFTDAVALQYGWDPVRLPDCCPCGVKFSVEHGFSYPKDGFPSIRHWIIKACGHHTLVVI